MFQETVIISPVEVEYLLDDKQVDDVTFNNIYHPLSLTVQKTF